MRHWQEKAIPEKNRDKLIHPLRDRHTIALRSWAAAYGKEQWTATLLALVSPCLQCKSPLYLLQPEDFGQVMTLAPSHPWNGTRASAHGASRRLADSYEALLPQCMWKHQVYHTLGGNLHGPFTSFQNPPKSAVVGSLLYPLPHDLSHTENLQSDKGLNGEDTVDHIQDQEEQ